VLAATAHELQQQGLLVAGPGCTVSELAVFCPVHDLGEARPIVLGARCTIAAFAIVHGGAELDAGVRVEDHVIVGQPERGYAVRNIYPGAGALTTIGAGAVLRAGAVLYAGVSVGAESVVGHHTLLRSHVRVGQRSQLGHHLTVERAASLGEWVRCSPGSTSPPRP